MTQDTFNGLTHLTKMDIDFQEVFVGFAVKMNLVHKNLIGFLIEK